VGASYTLEKLLGQGRHGALFDGRHTRLGGHHMVRVLALDGGRRSAVATAMSQYSAVVHPNLAGPQDILTLPDEQLVLCAPLLPGVDLSARVNGQGKLTAAEATAVLRQAAAALHALHRRNLVHGNLSAGNVFFVFHDDISVDNPLGSSKGGQTVRVLDAGLYLCDLPPGQAAPTPLDDQRALGRLLLAHAADLPLGQRRVLERAQSERPEARYSSVLELWQAFEGAAAKAPGKHGPAGAVATALVPKITLPAKGNRRRGMVVAGAAAAALLVLGLVAFVVTGRGSGRDGSGATAASRALPGPADVHIAFSVDPPLATVSADGRSASAASGLSLPLGNSPVSIVVSADGYQSKTVTVVPSGARTLSVTLSKSSATASTDARGGGDGDDSDGDGDRKHKRHHHHRSKDKTEDPDPAMRSLPTLRKP
jgi:hypothetical protein